MSVIHRDSGFNLFNELKFWQDLWHQNPWSMVWCSLHDPMFSHFDRTRTCDRQMV